MQPLQTPRPKARGRLHRRHTTPCRSLGQLLPGAAARSAHHFAAATTAGLSASEAAALQAAVQPFITGRGPALHDRQWCDSALRMAVWFVIATSGSTFHSRYLSEEPLRAAVWLFAAGRGPPAVHCWQPSIVASRCPALRCWQRSGCSLLAMVHSRKTLSSSPLLAAVRLFTAGSSLAVSGRQQQRSNSSKLAAIRLFIAGTPPPLRSR